MERPSISRIIDLCPLWAIWAYSKIFLLYKNLHRNVFCENANDFASLIYRSIKSILQDPTYFFYLPYLPQILNFLKGSIVILDIEK